MIFYSTFFPRKFLSPLSHYFSSLLSLPSLFLHLLSPLFRPKHHSPPNINITVAHFFWWVATRWVQWLLLPFFFFGDRCLKEEVGMAEVGCELWLGSVFGSLVVVGSWLGSVFGLWLGCG